MIINYLIVMFILGVLVPSMFSAVESWVKSVNWVSAIGWGLVIGFFLLGAIN